MEDKKMTEEEQEQVIDTFLNYDLCIKKITDTLLKFFPADEIVQKVAYELLLKYPTLALSILSKKEYEENRLIYKGDTDGKKSNI